MDNLNSKGVVRRIIEKDGEFIVSFPAHDGYFTVTEPYLRERVREAYAQKREISFTFDRDLNILKIV